MARGKRVVVVGGGVGGLSAAVRLAHGGAAVTLVEKNPQVGGKLNLWDVEHPHRPGERFKFDTGPSLITLPQVFEQLFTSVGERMSDHLKLLRLDPIQKYVWADGTVLEAWADQEAMEREVARISPGDVAGWRAFFERGRRIWELSAEMFLWHAPEQLLRKKDEPFDPRKALSMLTIPLRIGMFQRFSAVVDKHVKHPKLREVLYQYATYSGASPFLAPATLAVIPYAEFGFGGWYIDGGLYRLAEVLERLTVARGGVVRKGEAVGEVLVEPDGKGRGRVRGVRLAGGEELAADAVVVNADVVYAYERLIPSRWRRRYSDRVLRKLEPGGSGMVLLLGVEGRYEQLAHHTKFMPADYASDLRAMFETKTVPDDPCIYVCCSTKTDASQAPAGCENLFVLCSAPALEGHGPDWTTEGPRYRDQVVRTLEHRFGLTDLSRRIVVEKRYTPADLKRDYNANAGAIYGIGSNSRRTAFLRPPNRDRDVRGLYFAGGATHPGGGLPLVTLSGKIAAEMVGEDLHKAG
ncbi:MAG: phytoene desaturase family protein [Tepidisphaerales bacterium]